MTDFKVGDIAEVRDNGPILKAGERFTVKEVLGQRIRIDRAGASSVFSALIFRKVGGDPAREPVVAAASLEALISQGLESPVKTVQRAAERARDAVQRFVETEREERGRPHYTPRSQSWSASCVRPRPSSVTGQPRLPTRLQRPQPASPRCGPGACPRASTCLPRVGTCHVRQSRPTRGPTHEGWSRGLHHRLGRQPESDGLMSDIDPEVVRLLRDLLIHTDRLGVGHQIRAQDIARQLDLAGKVIIDKGSVPDWMEQAPGGLTSERMYRFKTES